MDHPPPLTEQHDYLVAVANRDATRLLTIADAVYYAAVRAMKGEEAVQEAIDKGWGKHVIASRRQHLRHVLEDSEPLSAEYEFLIEQVYDADSDLGRRIERFVWRER